jgi:hypothetical protein
VSLRMIEDVLACKDIIDHCPLCGRSFATVESSEEHIFPRWLQHHHDLWTQRLTIPNFVGKRYKSVKIRICTICNNERYGKREDCLSALFRGPNAHANFADIKDDYLAIWLGKIFWLLCRKSHSVLDFRTRDKAAADRIIPSELMQGTLFAGMIQRAFATRKRMLACYAGDPPDPAFYNHPYSLYRFEIDTRDSRFQSFDFIDNTVVLGVALRSGNAGLICVFDGGFHRRFRARRFSYLSRERLHPIQFGEVVARIFYDQTVLDDDARRVTYFWNRSRRSIIAVSHTPRTYDPYLAINHDPQRLAYFVGKHTFTDPRSLLFKDGRVFTSLHDHNGAFLRYAVTKEELEAARKDPHQILVGPLQPKWRNSFEPE